MMARAVVSLFSGGGGLDYGVALAGFEARLTIEKERYACQVLRDAKQARHILPDGHAYLDGCDIWEGDVADLDGAEALRRARVHPGEAALLVGGPPCVTFSVAGRREGLTSETGQLYQHYARLLRAFAPAAFIFENVKGILTAQSAEDDGRPAFDVIRAELEQPFRYVAADGMEHDTHYTVTWRLVDAADYGVPQHRHRVIIIGRRGDDAFAFPEPTHAHPQRLGLFSGTRSWQTVRNAFSGLPAAADLGEPAALRNHVAKRHSEEMRESYRATVPGKRNARSKRDRLLWDEPSKTIRAQGKPKADGSGQKNSSHQAIHPDDPRQLTPRECARLQTFPDWYPFPATLVNAYRVIGDAVPPELGRALGQAIAAQLDAQRAASPPSERTA